jgi:hypothetical protein
MSKKKKTPPDRITRFAVGTANEPHLNVWRLFSNHKCSECYLSNIKGFGNSYHFSMHKSGKCHMKIGEQRFDLPAPTPNFSHHESIGLLYPGYDLADPIPKPKSIGMTPEVNWYSRPEPDELRIFRIVFSRDPHLEYDRRSWSVQGPIRSVLYNKQVYVFATTTIRKMTDREIEHVRHQKSMFKILGTEPKETHVDAFLLYESNFVWVIPIDKENYEVVTGV